MGKMMMMMITQPDDDVHHHHHHHPTSSSSSSIDSNTEESSSAAGYYSYHHHHHHHHPHHHHSNSLSYPTSSLSSTNLKDHHHHLNTHLFLGLSLSRPSSSGGQYSDWPPIKGHLRNTLAAKSQSQSKSSSRPRGRAAENSLFVKVYREGIPIGRKLDLLSIHGYHSLISTLSLMFQTTILYPDVVHHKPSEKCHILIYEDKEGDWMMVGDVPWEMFLTVVKRLKIATRDTCQ